MSKHKDKAYQRYHIETKKTANSVVHPHRFQVKVKKLALAKLLIQELVHYRANLPVILSRPCVYGVFSGPVGGFAPREERCVGCLRCTTQYPEMVKILRNPQREGLGDAYFSPDQVDAVVYEAESGRIPIKGAGYRGKFGGEGWDGMWTDMSEIVRPTRDGIHGREFISTEIDIGEKLPHLDFDEQQQPIGTIPRTLSIPIPFLFDTPPSSCLSNANVCHILSNAAHQIHTLAIFPLETILEFSLKGSRLIPLLSKTQFESLAKSGIEPNLLEMAHWDEDFYLEIRSKFPRTIPILRANFGSGEIMAAFHAGVRVFHLAADYHGRGEDGRFVLDLICDVHKTFVERNCRDEVTLIGSGGISAAEHIPKAILCGLDAIALDTPVMAALQAKFHGDCRDRQLSRFHLPSQLAVDWGTQRLKNLAASWRDQLLEVLGAMGLREVRRLRGEMGRAMFQKDLEKEAFTGIAGYES